MTKGHMGGNLNTENLKHREFNDPKLGNVKKRHPQHSPGAITFASSALGRIGIIAVTIGIADPTIGAVNTKFALALLSQCAPFDNRLLLGGVQRRGPAAPSLFTAHQSERGVT
jgi:hypothetical protein